MIKGIGIDIVDNRRIRVARNKWGDNFLRKFLSKEEIKTYDTNLEHLCGAIALKEAAIKAFSGLITKPLNFGDVAVNKKNDKIPTVALIGKKMSNIGICASISHDGNFTVAIVVCEK